jgi:gluconokinase
MVADSEQAGAVLALDVGTSSCRASLYDARARPLGGQIGRVTYAPMITADGGAELEADVLIDHVCAAIDQALSAAPPRIVAVCASTFWHSLVGVDRDGQAITPVYLWLDARARGQMTQLRERLNERAIHARTGCVLHWTYWPAKLTWLRQTNPDSFRDVAKWVSFGELLFERLTGTPALSLSMASGTGLVDVHSGDWDEEVLEAIGVGRGQLNPIVPLEPAGASTRWPALVGAPWLPAVGDGACSNLGASCATPERFALMVGTSGAERAVWTTDGPFEIPWGAWCYRIDERRAVMGGALNDGGSLLDWLRASMQLPSISEAEREVAALQPDGHGLTVLPLWGGERNPGWADDASGAIVGLRLHTRPVEILRACLEAVALRFGQIDRILRRALPQASEVIATGGALLHSPSWMQIMADVLGQPVLASAESEASSRGASLLALESLGLLREPLEQMSPETTARYEPVPAYTERYRVALERQRRLYDVLVGN